MAANRFNPFRPGSLVNPSMFAGRSRELEILERILFQTKNGNPLHFLIRGERGIGKSSLLLYLKYVATGKIASLQNELYNFVVVSIELEPKSDYQEIIKRVGAEFQREVVAHAQAKHLAKKTWDFLKRWEVLGVKYAADTRKLEPYELLDDLASTFDQVVRSLEGVVDGVLITIDEADKPSEAAHLGEFCKLFTERLMKRGCDRVALGLSGLPQTIERLRESHESAPRVFLDIPLTPLLKEERIEVVRKGLNEANRVNKPPTLIENDAEILISDYSEGYPNFIQQFAYCAFDTDSDSMITEKDVKEGAHGKAGAFYQLGTHYFKDIYFEKIFSDDYRKVLKFMADFEDGWVAKSQIRQAVKLKESTLDNAITALLKRNIIIAKPGKKGEYRLPTRSFAVWIKAYTSNGH